MNIKLTRRTLTRVNHLSNAQKVAKIGSWETNLKDFTVSWSDETYRILESINLVPK
jgi:hypothetical protein